MTFHFDPAVGSPTVTDVRTGVAAFIGSFDVYTTTAITYTTFPYVEVFDSVTGLTSAQIPISPVGESGDDSATALPPTTQALIKWSTGVWVNGRQLVGKTFLPGFCEDSNETGGVLQTAIATVVTNGANALISALPLVVWSKTHSTFEPAATGTCATKWAYLSGRRD